MFNFLNKIPDRYIYYACWYVAGIATYFFIMCIEIVRARN